MRKPTRTFLAACSAVALSAAVYGCGGGGGGAPSVEPKPPVAVDFSGVAAGYAVDAGEYEIAAGETLTVNDVTFSCAADGPDCTVTVAADLTATYPADGGKVTAASAPLHGQRAAATAAIEAAALAIGGLSATSTEADVAAAQGALDAAKAALAGVTLLPASEVFALQDRIAAAEERLEAVKAVIDERETRQSQLDGANSAVEAAESAVNALTAASTDVEVSAAEQAIAAAKAAVAAGTLLTPAEAAALTGAIALAETSLGTVKAAIAERRTYEGQRAAAHGAVDAAASAIGGLSVTSTEAEVAAAQGALDAARAVLAGVTVLPASEVFALQERIDAAEGRLVAVKAAIAEREMRRSQLGAADGAVDAAERAVNALTAGSTDAEVAAADRAIAAAKAAVAAGTLLTAAERDALTGAIALAETSLATVKTAIAERKTHERQLGAVNAAVTAAQTAVDALDRTSTDAALAAAQTLIDRAAQAVSDGTLLSGDERSAASAKITASRTSLERVTVEAGIHAADTAIAALTATSTDAEVDAAQAAISAAAAALRRVQLLTGPQVIAFQGDIDAAKAALAGKRTLIADSKTHSQQLAVLDTAVSAAKTAVDGLDRLSTDAALAAAQAAIDAADAAVAAGTKLTVEEKSAANAKLRVSRTALERVTVDSKVYAAQVAVAGLSVASSDADVAAAQAAIDAARGALGNVRLLTAIDALAFRDSIDRAQADLVTVKRRIAASKEHSRQLQALNDAVDAASRAVSALSAGSTEADAAAAGTKIQAAKDAVSAGTALTDAEKAAANETIAAAETTLATRRAAITARRDRARAMSAALTAAPGATFDENLTAIDGGKVSIEGYEPSATHTAHAVAGWRGSVYEKATRDAEGGTVIERDTVVVYTDKAASKTARYTSYYRSGATDSSYLTDSGNENYIAPSGGFSWQPWVGVDGVSDDANGILDLTEGTAIGAADVDRLFGTGNFGAGQEKLPQKGDNRTYADEDDAVDGIQVAFSGSFHGVAGRFKCSAGTDGTCTAAMTNEGALTLAGSGAAWSFVPGTTNVSVAGAQEDADYLDFGYWVEWDADGGAGGAQAYTVEAFFKGKDPHGAVGSVQGSASYSGKAAGLYARRVYDGNTLLDDRSGRFTADVALRAHFGGGAVPTDDQNSISGTVSNFMEGGQPIDSGWSVTLNRIGGTGGTESFSGGTFTGGTTAGGGAAGTWSGAFYGDDAAVNEVTPQPSGAAGEFTAGFHNGDVVGAFGARKQ